MNKHGIRIAACALAGTFALSGYYTSIQAKISQPSTLPAAGIAVVLEEGTTIQELTQEVIQNIAYLESASGIQPNIVIAAEKVAMAEEPAQEETTVADSDAVRALVDSVSDGSDKGTSDSQQNTSDGLSAGFSATDIYEEETTEESTEESESETDTVEETTEEETTEEETTEEETEESTETASGDEQDFRGLVIARVNNYVNVRSIPSEEGEIVGKLYDKSVGEFEEEVDGWVKVAIEEGDGYVSREYVNLRTDFVHAESKEEEEARLAEEAKEREEARAAAQATEAARATQAAEQTTQKQAQTEAVIEAAQATAASSAGSEMGKTVIDYATQFVGNPYVYGGTSLTNGTDCSGFVMSVYANFGVSLPHSSSALRSKGYDVGGLANAQPGDIVCYSGHVALYIGNGQIVHASTSKTGIIISNANYRSILAVRRIF